MEKPDLHLRATTLNLGVHQDIRDQLAPVIEKFCHEYARHLLRYARTQPNPLQTLEELTNGTA